ncbi:MAG: mRNA surveillance protein pelota [Candidatus Altiarchaeota archaeon]
MRIEYKDLRHGLVRVRCESLDDLWYLSQVIASGDLVKGKSQRRIKDKDDTKSSGGERKTITLTVKVEKTDFKSDTSVLRVSGTIEEGPEDIVSQGSHHTLNVDADTQLTIIKERWAKTEMDRLNDAVKSTLRPKVIIVSLDEGEATLALLRESKLEYYDIGSNIGGKYDAKGRETRKAEFYRQLTQLIGNVMEKENAGNAILSGPGFEKNNYFKFLKEENQELAGKCAIEDTGSAGRNGIQEVLKREAIQRTIEEVNSVQDIRLVEDILKQIGKDTGLAAYGRKEVADAVNAGAAEMLLVTDALFFAERAHAEPLMNQVTNSAGKVHLINSESEAGQRLSSLGGMAAKLRYRMN